MSVNAALPRRFGTYLLTASLTEDALGLVFRGIRVSGERGFVRLRILESPEISEDTVLDAIEANGEIHTFLKNPAIARGVQMDSVDGVPFLAWNEPSGRTLDAVISKVEERHQGIPVEHALLIGEKVATALDHAYNTTVDGERTLHGLVWPGFVSLSDDGETRLTGFGLASGFFPSFGQPHFGREVAAYLAPEERADLAIAKNSDVFSVGVLLFQLLFGKLPSAADPLGDVKTATSQAAFPLPPEVVAVLRTCLSPSASRYQSNGELRRELGKILFSGPYSPSTFNLAFFLSGLFGAEIDAENRARAQESALDPGAIAESLVPAYTRTSSEARSPAQPAPSRGRHTFAIGGGLLLAAATAGTIYMITRRPPRVAPPRPAPVPTAIHRDPTPEPTSAPTNSLTDSQFKEEVARRVAEELRKLDQETRASRVPPAAAAESRTRPRRSADTETETEAEPRELPQPAVKLGSEPMTSTGSSSSVEPTKLPEAEPTAESKNPIPEPEVPPAQAEIAPKILRVVKPIYPPFALQARIRGIVLLRVLVSPSGDPQDIQVSKGVGALTQAAVAAVRRWKFEPARSNGQPVSAWITIPIPFEP